MATFKDALNAINGIGNTASQITTGKFTTSGDRGGTPITVPGTNTSTGITTGGYTNGSSSSGPSDDDRKIAANLGGVTGYNQQTILNNADNGFKVYDVADDFTNNAHNVQTTQNKQSAGANWYTQQQKLQSVTSQLADAAGNAMYGSFLNDMNDAIARRDDQDDVAILTQMRENQNTLDNDMYEALQQTRNARNELSMDTENDLRELIADYAAQTNNIHPDLASGLIDTEGHTINVPDWLQQDYFDEHLLQAIQPETQELYRPENAAATAANQGLTKNNTKSQFSSSGNESYWDRMNKGYSRRTQ